MTEMYDNTEWGHGNRPLFGRTLSNKQHGNLHVYYTVNRPEQKMWTQGITPPYHEVRAYTPEGDQVGHLQWHEDTGEILDVKVDSLYQRQGVATALHRHATQLSGEYGVPAPKHSADRSDQGDEWAKSIGGQLPKRLTVEDYRRAWGK